MAAGGAYSFSGGLHGVGVSVTNALAKRLEVTVYREGQVATVVFAGGDVVEAASRRARKGFSGQRHDSFLGKAMWPMQSISERQALPRERTRASAALQGGADAGRRR